LVLRLRGQGHDGTPLMASVEPSTPTLQVTDTRFTLQLTRAFMNTAIEPVQVDAVRLFQVTCNGLVMPGRVIYDRASWRVYWIPLVALWPVDARIEVRIRAEALRNDKGTCAQTQPMRMYQVVYTPATLQFTLGSRLETFELPTPSCAALYATLQALPACQPRIVKQVCFQRRPLQHDLSVAHLLPGDTLTVDFMTPSDTCCICLETFTATPQPWPFSCTHFCHLTCMEGWFARCQLQHQEVSCPTCRTVV